MLNQVLNHIGAQIALARANAFAGHPVADFIRNDAKNELVTALGPLAPGLLCKGSAGAGGWAEVSWLSVFDPVVTSSATQGYYVVYLFHANRPEVCLSLNQGTTAVQKEFGRRSLDVLRDRAALMRARLHDYAVQFSTEAIELGSDLALPRGYEAGHAFGRVYNTDALPAEADLRADLQNIVRAYLALTFRGGLDPALEGTEGVGADDGGGLGPDASLVEIRQYRMHRRIERNPKAAQQAKAHHGLVCQACDFDFAAKYGALGQGYIEAHHLRPLGTLEEGVPVTYNVDTDFAVLCSNCHRMIHRTDDPSDLHEFSLLVNK